MRSFILPGDLGFEPIQLVGKLGVGVLGSVVPGGGAFDGHGRGGVVSLSHRNGWIPRRGQEQSRQRELDGCAARSCGGQWRTGGECESRRPRGRSGAGSASTHKTARYAVLGSSFVAGPQEFLFQAEVETEQVAVVDVDMARSESVRRIWLFLRDRRIDHYTDITKSKD